MTLTTPATSTVTHVPHLVLGTAVRSDPILGGRHPSVDVGTRVRGQTDYPVVTEGAIQPPSYLTYDAASTGVPCEPPLDRASVLLERVGPGRVRGGRAGGVGQVEPVGWAWMVGQTVTSRDSRH